MNFGIKNVFNCSLKKMTPLIATTAILAGSFVPTNKTQNQQNQPLEYFSAIKNTHPMDGTIYLKNYHPDLVNLKTNKIISQLPELNQLYRKVH